LNNNEWLTSNYHKSFAAHESINQRKLLIFKICKYYSSKMIRKNGNMTKINWYHNFHESLMAEMPTTHALRLTNTQINCPCNSLLSWIMNPTAFLDSSHPLNRK
jgi:hypothetical protein